MDALGDGGVSEVALFGPAQGGKTDIGLNWAGWIITTDPSDMLICQPSQAMSHNFVVSRLDPMIANTAIVRSKLMPFSNSNNIELKQFRGMFLANIWPVAAQFAQRPIRFGWIDDFDQMEEDIGAKGDEGGQGSAISLLEGRHTSYEGREKKFVSSSPASESGGKTEAFVEGGTDERLNPRCPECDERFEINIMTDLHFDRKGSAEEAESSAHVVCPNNGCILPPASRRDLLNTLIHLPNRGFVARNQTASSRRRSFRIDGLMALTSWPKLARLWREAEIEFEKRQDETLLRTFVNTKAGQNYRPKAMGEKPLRPEDLTPLQEAHWALGSVPPGPVVITIAVDVQGDRFECMAIAWADGMEGWIIDRWSIDLLDGDDVVALEPFRKPEHWRVLLPLFDKTWPLADGSGRSPKPLAVAIDTGGGGDKDTATATENAFKFWHLAVAGGVRRSRIMLVKGSSNPKSELVSKSERPDKKVSGGSIRGSAELWLVNSHRGKFIANERLRRLDPGPGRIHLPHDFQDKWKEEFTAEQLNKKGKWEKTRNRNETLDLYLYGWFALIKPPFAKTKSTMDWVPNAFRIHWAAPAMAYLPLSDPRSADPATERDGFAPNAPPPPRPAAAVRKIVRRPHGSWMGRLR